MLMDPNDSRNILSYKVYDLFKHKFDGVFIELGAYDGLTSSNTYLLEYFNNWSGLLIEPSECLLSTIKSNRSKNTIVESCGISNFEGILYGDFNGHPMSSINGERQNNKSIEYAVPCTTLSKLCEKHKLYDIDICSIDVEGNEFAVLMGIDFNKINIHHFIIEIYKKDENTIFDFLSSKNYTYTCLSNFNKNTHPNWDETHQDYLFTKV